MTKLAVGSRAASIGVALMSMSGFAQASGQLPVVLSTQNFASYGECRAALEAAHGLDRKRVAPRVVAEDGSISEVGLDSVGIEPLGSQAARYEATLWYHHGKPRPDGQDIEVSHTYEHVVRECRGEVMQISERGGYTLSTFEPLAQPGAQK